jgi:hypothetical protein
MATEIRVTGLKELRRDLKALGDLEGTKELRQGLKKAADIVAVDARNRAQAFSQRAASSIAAGTSGNRAFVAGGRKSITWYGWADFGSRKPKLGNPRSVGPWTKSGKGPDKGRFIYAALDAKSEEIRAAVADGLDHLLKSHDL